MNKKIITIPITVIVLVFIVNFSLESTPDEDNGVTFHVTLANSNLYVNGSYTEKFTVKEGNYIFRFVPNGSSPEILSISLNGPNFDFYEDFKLRSIPHQTGISEYFTWEYDGQKTILVSEIQEVTININPNGNVMGSVSVDILENKEA
ncbi:MAG: hypothetical protein ACR2LL_05055 [Nitrosopumilus sp.]